MKVGEVISGYPPYYTSGGASRAAQHISEELADRGHSIQVFTTTLSEPGNEPSELRDTDRKNLQVSRANLISNGLGYTKKIPVSTQFRNDLRDNIGDLDLVHLHEFRTIHAYFVGKIAEDNEIPVVFQPHGSLPRLNKLVLKKVFDTVFSGQILQSSDTVVFSSDSEIDAAPETFRNQIHDSAKVPNGIDLAKYYPSEERPKVFEEHDINKSDDVVLFLSRVAEGKGLKLLIKAVNELSRDFPDLTLVIAGPDEGALEPAMAAARRLKIEDAVTYVGPIYGKEKIRLFSSASAFVLPSDDFPESFGNVVLEALACGTLTVATNVCGVTEWLSNEYLEVCEPNLSSLQNSIRTHLETQPNPSQRDLARDLESFEWGEIAERYESLYENVLNHDH
jgi:glycosyltransferase involved in cell wall biosynthesis